MDDLVSAGRSGSGRIAASTSGGFHSTALPRGIQVEPLSDRRPKVRQLARSAQARCQQEGKGTMANKERDPNRGHRPSPCSIVSVILILSVLMSSGLVGCGPSAADLAAVDYTPLPEGDWKVSTPEEQGLDPVLLDKLYHEAADLETLYGLLVIKNGVLIAEKYFNEGSIDQLSGRQSSTKSFTSALVGIALDQGCLQSVDQKMMDFFPEFADEITDPRKGQITMEHLLQMRGGYPDEEMTSNYFEIMFFQGNWEFLPHVVDFPLTSDPGTEFQYSNLTSHLLGVIVTRACRRDLESFAQEYLFSPMDAELHGWQVDDDGYNWGFGEIYLTARDMAKFGQMVLDGGVYDGQQIISEEWVEASLQRYSKKIVRGWLTPRYGSFRDRGYGYQWWSSRVGKHHIYAAEGHGGNYIILLDDLDMVIVTTADPLHDMWDKDPWKYEGAVNQLVGRFIKSLPKE
jgi:CubicO group peptidase (beta-lactamase class C family)